MTIHRDIWGSWAGTERATPSSTFLRDFSHVPSAATPTIVLASFISNVMAMVLPFVILIVYDRVLPNATDHTLMILAAGVFVAVLIDVAVRIGRGYIVALRAARYGHRAFMGSVTKILFADPKDFQTTSTAKRLEQLGAIDTIRESRAGYLPQLLVDFPFFVLFVGAVFLIGKELGFVLLACIVILALTSVLNGLEVRRRVEARQDTERAQTNFLLEILQGLLTIKSYSMERLMERRYERVMERSARVTHDVVEGGASAQAMANFVTQATLGAIVAFGSLMVIDGEMTIGGVAACMLLAGRATQPLNRAAMLWSQYQSVRIAKDHVQSLSELSLAAKYRKQWLEEFQGRIELRGVSFRYDAEKPLFDEVDLTFEAGAAVGVSGENWAGKSTLLSLVAGILRPDTGTIFYDGVDVNQLSDAELRRHIAYLPYNPALFDGTILENLCGFSDDPERIAAAEEAAREIGLAEAVSKLSRGFNTEISSSTRETLPASLRQQIPIAAALARQPRVIIMDECNSNLDQDADRLFREALARRKGTCTLILVSQRPSFLAIADRTLVLGRDTGTTGRRAKTRAPQSEPEILPPPPAPNRPVLVRSRGDGN